jgi:hypothetical protein
MAYLHLVDQLEAMVMASVQAALFARYLGRDVEVPDVLQARRRFDEALAAEPVKVNREEAVMLEAIGLRGG